MDFNPNQTQAELRGLAAEVLTREAAVARLDAHDASGQPYERGIWKAMAQAGLLGACLPEEAGGAGLGAIEMAVVLRETGVRVAPVPALPSLVAALTIATYGTPEQRAALAPLAEGESVLAVALREPGPAGPVRPAAVTARPDGSGGFRLDGRTGGVPYALESSRVLVPAATDDGGAGLFLVDPATVAATHAVPTATGEPCAALELNGTPGEAVGDADAVAGLRRIALAGITATASGALAGALELTTEHIRTRRQFGRALAEFQAVTVQIADVYIAGRALDVAMWSGAWRIDNGLPEEAELDLSIAAHTAADSALAALYTCQHLHGGLGVDITYPLHRYFALAKHCAHLLGGAEAQLDTIGALV
ncbi:acyl-CoA dehydrogenase family protein [Thermopolyspora sp. NPDC052614]|uniref:acyl-CoA dehydrogenase family protein n=1 Tax=Thermopolyspora sp. NPDC052614 TaxID=3155682 RepID=UPI003428C29E